MSGLLPYCQTAGSCASAWTGADFNNQAAKV
jgi:hypothetical protein